MEERASSPRRHVLGALASAVGGLFAVKLGRRERVPARTKAAPPLPGGPAAEPDTHRAPRLAVKPARNTVKRHG